MKRAIFATMTAFAAASALIVSGAGAANAIATTVYDATEPTAGNVPSIGFEATSTSEFGDEIQLAAGPRKLNTVTVQMSSWGCQAKSGSNCVTTDASARVGVPITLNVYKASHSGPNGTVVAGDLITTVTQTIAVPFRPGANLAKCPGGQWYDKKNKACYNGKAFNAVFKFKALKVTVPDDVVLGVAYNTSHHGYNPIGVTACNSTPQGCIYDSLNVGLGTTGVATGSKPNPGTVFANSSWSGFFCDSTPAVGVFNQDSPTSACWGGTDTAFKVVTN
jgi:hypothetical protein